MSTEHKAVDIGAQTALASRAATPDQVFLADMQDLFSGRRFAHAGYWRYSEPLFPGDVVNGVELWNRITERAKDGGNYYIFSDEVSLIRASLPDILRFISEDTAFIDLGPGSKEAILDKVGVILEAAGGRITGYIAVDLSPEILKNAEALFASQYPAIKFTPALGDIFSPLTLPPRGNRFAVIFGQTMFNLAVSPFDDALAKEKISRMLAGLRAHLRPGERIAIPQNCSEDREEIEAAYREQEAVWLNLFHRVQRDLPIKGDYDPDGFSFQPYWISSSCILSHSVLPTKAMTFEIGGEIISLVPGDRLYLHNTAIYPESVFTALAEAAGFSRIHRCMNEKRRMALHILEARE
jgi:uncharacterized SAM-dependent methyltransferase